MRVKNSGHWVQVRSWRRSTCLPRAGFRRSFERGGALGDHARARERVPGEVCTSSMQRCMNNHARPARTRKLSTAVIKASFYSVEKLTQSEHPKKPLPAVPRISVNNGSTTGVFWYPLTTPRNFERSSIHCKLFMHEHGRKSRSATSRGSDFDHAQPEKNRYDLKHPM